MQNVPSDAVSRGLESQRDSDSGTLVGESPLSFCPACSARLMSRKCKLLCPVCGYYMSCSDYY